MDVVVKACLDAKNFAINQTKEENPVIFLGKSDHLRAFRQVPLARKCWKFLVIMADSPSNNNKKKYFVDKCLPFGLSISCAIYQHVSNALAHLMCAGEHEAVRVFCVVNYLDDFLFIEITKAHCNALIQRFLDLCEDVCLAASLEKTEWAEPLMVFLGNLLNGRNMTISIPLDKKQKALRLLNDFLGKKKSTVKQLQVLTRFLNFLSRAIFPGRAFTRRIYSKFRIANRKLKHYHHVSLDKEFKFDLEVWRLFLTHHNSTAVCRPMVDLNKIGSAKQLCFYSDVRACEVLRFGVIFNKKWIFGKWEPNFIKENKPSIEFLEMFALVAAILTWGNEPALRNARIVVFCDNAAVVQMLNESTS